MRFPGFVFALGLSAGIIAARAIHFRSEWTLSLLVMLLPCIWFSRGKKLFLPFFVLAVFLTGMLAFRVENIRSRQSIENKLEQDNFSQTKVSLEGVVLSEPVRDEKGKKIKISFVLESRNLFWKIKIPTYRVKKESVLGKVQVFIYQPKFIPKCGDKIRVWGQLEKPRPVLNPGEFDYGQYLSQQGIGAVLTGYGEKAVIFRDKGEIPWILNRTYAMRTWIRNRIETYFKGRDEIFFKALILGERKKISSVLRDDFMKTGTSHLLAISGLNISLTVGSFCFLLLFFGAPQKFAAMIAIFFSVAQMAIAGWGIPVERAGLMAILGFIGVLVDRSRNSLNTFFIIFSVLLLWSPSWLFNIAFQLSFLSVFALIVGMGMTEEKERVASELKSSFVVLIFTFPVVCYYFNVFSPISILANIGAIPLFNGALLGAYLSLAVGSIPGLGFICLKAAHWWLEIGLWWISFLAQKKWGYFFIQKPFWIQIGIYYLCLGIWISKRLNGVWQKTLLMSLWGLVCFSFFLDFSKNNFEITFLSAGKNELAFLEFGASRRWLINAGRSAPSDQAQWIITPFLKYRGIKRFDGVIVQDFYSKHAGGLETISRNFVFDFLIYPKSGDKRKTKFLKLKTNELNTIEIYKQEMLGVGKDRDLVLEKGPGERLWIKAVQQQFIFVLLPEFNWNWKAYFENQKWVHSIYALYLPASEYFSEADVDFLIDLFAPEFVLMPTMQTQLQKHFYSRNVEPLSLSEAGAVSFFLKNSKNEMMMRTFLKR